MTRTVFNILAEAATDSIRTETYQGREYVVVPVIALVEGVLHSANAENPELALADEFGRFPESWNGRPVVMNHPQVNGQFVSANDPAVLDDWAIGMVFNSKMDDGRLKVEAWLDVAKINAMGGEALSTLTRIQNGELVEVSTGLFASVEETSGLFDGRAYKGVWRNIAADHLALLPEGVIGACSVENGCGVPRINMFRSVNPSPKASCNCGCGCDSSKGGSPMTNVPELTAEAIALYAELGVNTASNLEDDKLPDVVMRSNKLASKINGVLVNSIPSDMPFENAEKIVRAALDSVEAEFAWIITMSSDSVVYENWDSYGLWQRTYTINEDGSQVTLGEDRTKVHLLTKVAPVGDQSQTSSGLGSVVTNSDATAPAPDPDSEVTPKTSESDSTNTKTNSTQETAVMSQGTNDNGAVTPTTDVTAAEGQTEVTSTTASTTEPSTPAVNAATTTAAEPRVQTVNEYVAAAPAEMQEVLMESLRLHSSKKNTLVESLKANANCDYAEDELKAMSLRDLERLAKLAHVPTFAGAAGSPMQINSVSNDVPPPPALFPASA